MRYARLAAWQPGPCLRALAADAAARTPAGESAVAWRYERGKEQADDGDVEGDEGGLHVPPGEDSVDLPPGVACGLEVVS